jgi:hypothetical protein
VSGSCRMVADEPPHACERLRKSSRQALRFRSRNCADDVVVGGRCAARRAPVEPGFVAADVSAVVADVVTIVVVACVRSARCGGAVAQSVDEQVDHALGVAGSVVVGGQTQVGHRRQQVVGLDVGADLSGGCCGLQQRCKGGSQLPVEVGGQGVEGGVSGVQGGGELACPRNAHIRVTGACCRVLAQLPTTA